MFERIDGLQGRVVGMRAHPEVADEELRSLLHVGPEPDGFGYVAWRDLTRGSRATHVDRSAVVTEHATIRTGLGLAGSTLRGRVRSFRNEEHQQATDQVPA